MWLNHIIIDVRLIRCFKNLIDSFSSQRLRLSYLRQPLPRVVLLQRGHWPYLLVHTSTLGFLFTVVFSQSFLLSLFTTSLLSGRDYVVSSQFLTKIGVKGLNSQIPRFIYLPAQCPDYRVNPTHVTVGLRVIESDNDLFFILYLSWFILSYLFRDSYILSLFSSYWLFFRGG